MDGRRWFFRPVRSERDDSEHGHGCGEESEGTDGRSGREETNSKEEINFHKIIWEETLPYALLIGVPYDLFWHLTPKKFESFEKAYKLKRQIEDENNWCLGIYFCRSLSVALDNAFNGKNAKSRYFEQPIFSNIEKQDQELSEEEKDRQVDLFFKQQNAMRINWKRSHRNGD